MALSRDVVIRLQGDATSAIAAQKAAADAAEVSVAAYRKAEREYAKQQAAEKSNSQARQQAMKESAQTAVVMGAAMLAAFGVAAKASMEFDKAMSATGAATMANAQQFDALRKAALDAGAATMYSATEAAQAETELAKAGISVKDILGGGLKGALDLAAAGQLDVASAAEIAATALQQFHLTGSQTPHVADLLAAGAGKAMGSVQDLAGALKYVGPVAAGMGVSIEQTTGTLAMFAQAGILGEQAGTSLRGVISALASPSKIAQTQMDDLGISVFDAQGKFKGLDGVAGELHDSMKNMTEAERSAALGRIFGNEQLTAARVLYEQGAAGVQQWTDKVNDSGYAAEQAARLTDNLAGDLERLGGSISTVLIGGGSKATGVLRFLTQAATGTVNAFGELPGPLAATAEGLLGVVGTGTLLLGIVGSIIPRIQEARAALEGLGAGGAAANRALGVVGKVGGIAAGAALGVGVLSAAYDALHPPAEVVVADTEHLSAQLSKLANYAHDSKGALADVGLGKLIEQLQLTEDHTYDTVTGLGSLGKAAAMTNLSFGIIEDQAQHANDGFKQAQQSIKDVNDALSGMVSAGHAEAAAAAMQRLFEAWTASGGTASDFKEKFAGAVTALRDYKSTSETTVSATGEITNGLGEAATAADILKAAFDALNGVQLTQAEANIKWTQTLADLKIAAKDGSDSLDLNTKAGADNAQQFIDAAQRANEFSQAVADTSGLEAGRAKLADLRQSLLDSAEAAGFDRDKVAALIDVIFQVPADTPAAVTLHDQATPGINAVNSLLDHLDGKTAHTTVTNTVVTEYLTKVLGGAKPYSEAGSGGNPIGLPPVGGAIGGIVHAFAGGGFQPMQGGIAQIVAPQTYRLIGDRITDDEAYIPINGDARSHAILRATAGRMGYAVGRGIPVGQSSGQGAAPLAIDYGRLGAAIAAASPKGGVQIGQIVTQRNETAPELAAHLTFLARTS